MQAGQTFSDAYGPVNSFEPTAQSLQLSRGAQAEAASPIMDTREEALLRGNIGDLRALGQQVATERALRNMGDLADAYRASGMTGATGDDQGSSAQQIVITGSRMSDEQKAQYDIAQLAAAGQYYGSGSIKPIGAMEGFFTFNPVGRFMAGWGQSAAGIVSSLYTVPREAGLTVGDAVGNATYGALNWAFGGSQVYENDSALFRSIDDNGALGTIGLGITGTARSLPGISQIDAINRRDMYALGASGPTTLLAGAGLLARPTTVLGRENIVGTLGEIVQPHLGTISQLDSDALVGFRGSVARGFKGDHKANLPFNPADFDVDAFIVSDQLAASFGRGVPFRSGAKIPQIAEAQQAIDYSLRQTPSFSGLRAEPFTFRIYTQREIQRLQGRGDAQYFFLNPEKP